MNYATGWVDDRQAVAESLPRIERIQECSVMFAAVAQGLIESDDDRDIFLWKAEEKLFGKKKPSLDQKRVGACVSFGWGRGGQDLIYIAAANGEADAPVEEICTECIYGGSRVEIGGGRIRGDGSVGAWASEQQLKYGNLLYKKYPELDLTSGYLESRAREWGSRGIPDNLEPTAKVMIVKTTVLVTTAVEAWAALGNWYPIPVCSNRGFTTRLVKGYCEPSGVWNHCMVLRGRFVSPDRGKSFVIQNSWGGYLQGDRMARSIHGEFELPEGCFCTTDTVVDGMLKQRDSFAMSGVQGLPRRDLTWLL